MVLCVYLLGCQGIIAVTNLITLRQRIAKFCDSQNDRDTHHRRQAAASSCLAADCRARKPDNGRVGGEEEAEVLGAPVAPDARPYPEIRKAGAVTSKALLSNRGGKCPEGRGHRSYRAAKANLSDLRTPCFYWSACKGLAEVSKCGRGVCRKCANAMPGVEFPLHRGSEMIGELGRLNRNLDYKAAFPAV